jgi:hypothetical protein
MAVCRPMSRSKRVPHPLRPYGCCCRCPLLDVACDDGIGDADPRALCIVWTEFGWVATNPAAIRSVGRRCADSGDRRAFAAVPVGTGRLGRDRSDHSELRTRRRCRRCRRRALVWWRAIDHSAFGARPAVRRDMAWPCPQRTRRGRRTGLRHEHSDGCGIGGGCTGHRRSGPGGGASMGVGSGGPDGHRLSVRDLNAHSRNPSDPWAAAARDRKRSVRYDLNLCNEAKVRDAYGQISAHKGHTLDWMIFGSDEKASTAAATVVDVLKEGKGAVEDMKPHFPKNVRRLPCPCPARLTQPPKTAIRSASQRCCCRVVCYTARVVRCVADDDGTDDQDSADHLRAVIHAIV